MMDQKDDVSHAEIMTAIGVLSIKMDHVQTDVTEVKTALKVNSGRLVALEKWVESHDAVVRFAKWGLALAIAGGSITLAAAKFLKS